MGGAWRVFIWTGACCELLVRGGCVCDGMCFGTMPFAHVTHGEPLHSTPLHSTTTTTTSTTTSTAGHRPPVATHIHLSRHSSTTDPCPSGKGGRSEHEHHGLFGVFFFSFSKAISRVGGDGLLLVGADNGRFGLHFLLLATPDTAKPSSDWVATVGRRERIQHKKHASLTNHHE